MDDARDSDGGAGILTVDQFSRRLCAAAPRIQSRVRPLLSRRLRRFADSDDIWQETCLVALKRRARFVWRGRAAFVRWLLTIATRMIQREARRAHVGGGEAAWADAEAILPGLPCPRALDPGVFAELRDEADHIRGLIARLPAAQREVCTLDLERRLRPVEMARLLGKTITTIRKHQHRALRTLRRVCRVAG
jgi:RNA polymerase sigma factor (sigma-70 family)